MQIPQQDNQETVPSGQDKDAIVGWDEKEGPFVSPDNIGVTVGHGICKIRWQGNDSVEAFEIRGLEGIDQFEFDSADPKQKTVKYKDKATRAGQWKYAVWVKPKGGPGKLLDPKITNGSR